MTGYPGSTVPTLPRKELRKYYGLGRVSALPAHAFRGPTPAVTVARIWWGRLWRIGVRFLRDRCSHRRVRRGRGGRCGGLFRFLCRFVAFRVIQLWRRGWIFRYLRSFRPVWHAFRVGFSANRVLLHHLYPCCVSRGSRFGCPNSRGAAAGKYYGKAALPGLERGWCHGWAPLRLMEGL